MSEESRDITGRDDGTDRWRAVPARLDDPDGPAKLSRRHLRTWVLVLEARHIPNRSERHRFGWRLLVPAGNFDRAVEELIAYETENRNWPPPPPPETPLVDNTFTTIWVLIGLAAFFDVTLLKIKLLGHWPVDWRALGNADAGRIVSGEWWRAVTALTLHGDWPHLLGNLLIGGIFIDRVCRDLRSGLGWSLILASGVLGNLLNAWLQSPAHRAVGASTAIFGAVGLLAAISLVRYRHNLRLSRRWALPVAAAVGLLAMLGAGGENTDLGAHLWGFVAGLLLGGGIEQIIERRGRPGRVLNVMLALASATLVAGAWWLALEAGR